MFAYKPLPMRFSYYVPSHSLANWQKRRILLRQDKSCFYCGKKLTLSSSTLDHCIPKSKGGSDDFDNLVLACKKCNQDKADKIYIKRG